MPVCANRAAHAHARSAWRAVTERRSLAIGISRVGRPRSRSHASSCERKKRAPNPCRRRKWTSRSKAPLLMRLRTRLGLTLSSAAVSVIVRYSSAICVTVVFNSHRQSCTLAPGAFSGTNGVNVRCRTRPLGLLSSPWAPSLDCEQAAHARSTLFEMGVGFVRAGHLAVYCLLVVGSVTR